MSFWRAGALLQKDTRHWLAVAMSVAQTQSFHRASRNTNNKMYKLRKRLWWSIYIRERQSSAALGVPKWVRDEDCDIEALSEDDFQYAFDASSPSARKDESIYYTISMKELSRVLGCIVHRDFLPSKRLTPTEREELSSSLADWRTALPICIQLPSDNGVGDLGFLPSMLHLTYNNLLFLLFRSGYSVVESSDNSRDRDIVTRAAAHNCAIIEHMIDEGQIRHSQIHVITNIFNTLCIHTYNSRPYRVIAGL
ncbi:hypothetical protein FOBRF1_015756 [Fusarium oxysporum]